MDEGCNIPAAAFTVKYEMLDWLEKNDGLFSIFRIRDGGADKSVTDITDDYFKKT